MIELELESETTQTPMVSIKVIGVGGAGGNTVNSIIESGNHEVECVVANTDAQALNQSRAIHRIQLGVKSTKGLGTGSNPDLGKRAAEEDLDKIVEVLGDADIVFLAAGMGGGTGSGAISVIARALKERDILTVAIVTRPFIFEGKRRAQVADTAIERLQHEVDTLIVLPNQKLLEVVAPNASMIEAFGVINNVLSQAVKGISDIITKPGHINVDFSDIRTIMKDRGVAVMGTGIASGPDRAQKAAMQAIASPIFENMSITGAHGVLLNITGGKNLGLHEISQAASIIYQEADEDANIILGSVIDETLSDEVIVTIIATGFDGGPRRVCELEVPKEIQGAVATTVVVPEAESAARKHDVVFKEDTCDELIEPAQEVVAQAEVAVEEEQSVAAIQEENGALALDVDDLDLPAFMRKEVKERSKTE
jgi:cell division protein FtsZ